MTEYTITTEDENGVDVVTTSDPCHAVDIIQDARRGGADVTYTGDPFADVARLASEED